MSCKVRIIPFGLIGFIRHIALFVPDLRQAEAFFQSLFDMELLGREAELEDGLWYTLPFDKGWEDAQAAAGLNYDGSRARPHLMVSVSHFLSYRIIPFACS